SRVSFILRSLDTYAQNRAIGVILSGTASDGAIGLREIKAGGGITVAQQPESAKDDGGPRGGRGAAIPVVDAQRFRIFALIRNSSVVDFTLYKQPTIKRRLQRRMVLNKVASIDQYIKLLEQNPDEVKNLYHDILI